MENSFSYVDLDKEIREHREGLHMSQEGLGEQVGVSVQEIEDIERGAQDISVEMLVKIAFALDVYVDELLGYTLPRDEVCYDFSEPENPFETIRRALDRLEAERYYIR